MRADYSPSCRAWFAQNDLDVWQDIVALPGGWDWWSQIVDVLTSPSVEHLVLIVTPSALESIVIREEIRDYGETYRITRTTRIVARGCNPIIVVSTVDISVSENMKDKDSLSITVIKDEKGSET